ncbi:PilZ domain-containing protein [Pelotomaculum isophthalicicum JI]|uniref:PilZ domain-containing protein n=1 Tax=Pelotomaculum isophthalicicum JI TaxID=947010 RepID=A0A9X4GYL4_9FIRM|nr:PilZ domain-containing protein [Pelotomaculum isophthalicicum]MDF9407940.1 PilZ domain-containing protein [Pelotomaculum isophthalicicum JI]
MTNENDIIVVKQEVNLQVSEQIEFKAIVTEVDEKLFWIGLPRINGQVLMLQEKQRVKVSLVKPSAFYSAETSLEEIGTDSSKFYGLAIPEHFGQKKRKFLSAKYATNVKFSTGKQSVQTTLVKFSAGGLTAYMVPDLAKMLQSGDDIYASFRISNVSFNIKVRLASLKSYDNIHYCGFEFLYLLPGVRKELDTLANVYSRTSV